MKDCDYCSGSGCVCCRPEPEKIEAPKIVEGRMGFSSEEVAEFFFKDEDEADIMVNYLNRRCYLDQTCPLLGSVCKNDCVCFQKAAAAFVLKVEFKHNDGYRLYGFTCDNPMLIRPLT